MLTLLLARPGATEYDQQGRIQGTLDIPLCAEGLRQSEAALEGVVAAGPTAVYTSPGAAAVQTGQMIAKAAGEQLKTTVKSKTIDKLHNLDHGLWQGMLVDEVKAKQPKVYRQWKDQPQTVCPPDGETILNAKTRVAAALQKLLKKHKEGTIAIVAPEPLTSVIRHVLRHEQLTDLWNCGEREDRWETIEVPEELAVGC